MHFRKEEALLISHQTSLIGSLIQLQQKICAMQGRWHKETGDPEGAVDKNRTLLLLLHQMTRYYCWSSKSIPFKEFTDVFGT